MEVLSKTTIQTWILPHLTTGRRGQPCRVSLTELVEAILYKLKSGCQWRQLPVKQFFTAKPLTWQGVFYHLNKWASDGSWKRVWLAVLKANKAYLDLSSMQLDGSHTPAKNGGQAVGYQGRKAARTSSSLFLADNAGVLLATSQPQHGNHHDLFEIESLFDELCQGLTEAGIELKGLFLHADAGFDAQSLRQRCDGKQIEFNVAVNLRKGSVQTAEPVYFDELLYQRRTVIERANAWLDSFKTLLVRFETSRRNWIAYHWLAFVVIFERKIKQKQKD